MIISKVKELIKSGQTGAAVQLLNTLISKDPNDNQSIKLLANIYYKNKVYNKAFELYKIAVSQNGMDLESLFAYGDLLIPKDALQAAKVLKTASGLCQSNSPQQRIVNLKLIKALREAKKYDESISFCKKLLKKDPKDIRALNAIGQLYQHTEKREKAIETFELLTRIKPDLPQALHNLAELYKIEKEQLEKAEKLFKKAIDLSPNWAAPKRGYANCLMHRGDFLSAKKQLISLVQTSPEDIENHKALAQWYVSQGECKIALTHFEDALKLKAKDTETIIGLGLCYQNLGSDQVALKYYEEALQIEEEYTTLNSIANIHKKQQEYNKAIKLFKRSIELNPDQYAAFYYLSECYASTIQWDQRVELDQKQIALIKNHIREKKVNEDLPLLIFNYYDIPIDIHQDMAVFTAENQKLNNEYLTKNIRFKHEHNLSGILNIGYISPDFRDHPVGRLMAPLFENHNRDRVKVFGYALTSADQRDQYRKQIKSGCDVFRDLSAHSVKKSVEQIKADKIDIIVDLAGHTAHNRHAIYMCKPAPLSCHIMGFPGTVGGDYHDYIIGDAVLTPLELSKYYTEKIIQIPNSFIGPYQTIDENIPTRADLNLPEDKFIYAGFNRPGKIEPHLFRSWMNILKATPDSVLLLSRTSVDIQDRFGQNAHRQGVTPDRLLFSEHLPYKRYLQSHRLLDLFLDTWHYSAGSTLIAALSSGLPALTVIDDTNASRMGGCIIHAVGHHDLITTSLAAYESKAIELYHNQSQLSQIRSELIKNGRSLPLFDYKNYSLQLEHAYSKIYQNYLSDTPPENTIIK